MGKSDGQQSGNYTGNWDDMAVCYNWDSYQHHAPKP